VAERVRELQDRGITPGLAAVLVGDDPASRLYVGAKHKACADVGIRSEQVDLPAFVTEAELLATIRRLNRDPEIHGIIVQLPVPKHISELTVQQTVDPAKDVDGLLRTGISLDGAEVCVVGYGELVGAPLSIMLAQDSIRGNATVTITHVRTKDLGEHTKRADILVAAAGLPEMITGDMVKPGATVLDVGVHRTERGMVGDVKFDEVSQVAGAITPVPGGVGPMTVAMLMVNTVTAAELATYRP
jgi:methylenetetrahydrofolate dehydrogenase (NADP+) / methenyltetrahydrofolate cyclohydrolase